MDAFLGTILAVGFSYPPRGWMTCAGQILPINANGALFALLGTQYGGDGQTTFALPDLRGRIPVGQSLGQTAPGHITGNIGQVGGTTATTVISTGSVSVSLSVANLPSHNHNATFTPAGGGGATTVTINASKDSATSPDPLPGGYLAAGASDGPNPPFLYSSAATGGTVQMNAGMTTVGGGGSGGGTVAVSNTGTGTPVVAPVTTTANISTTPPFLTIQYIICISGIYPSRN